MKLRNLAVAVVLGTWLLHGGEAIAQRSIATYSKEAMDNLVPLLGKADAGGYKMEPSTTTMFGGWLPKGNGTGNEKRIPMIVLKNLDPNMEYRVITAGDNDIKDLDVRVVDPTGKVVAVDVAVARTAAVTFQPARAQDYVVEMRVYDSVDNGICVGGVLRRRN
ncbi:MAG: hypothetical protein EXS16_15135 [Gemmataceae bacterium]|nr:hypothetical protein [Gemmataceae bacterium]